jgi:hypothetical protein
VLVVVALAGGFALGDAWARRHDHSSHARTARLASATSPRSTTDTPSPAASPAAAGDPFQTPAMRTFIASRHGDITAAVEDAYTHQTFLYRPGVTEQTASIIKVDILETLLAEAQASGQRLDSQQTQLATGMIENSSNDDAQDLWDGEGGSTAVAAYNARIGLTHTDPNTHGFWGESTTTAADQIRLLRQLAFEGPVLSSTSRDYELGLMEQVEADQQWGVSGGIPTGAARVAIKNGWLPLGSADWQINSIGRIEGSDRHYLLAVLTTGDHTEQYGINTIQGISALIWKDLVKS